MSDDNKIQVYVDDATILIKNHNGKYKTFPRCGITDVEMFVYEMAKTGRLNDLA